VPSADGDSFGEDVRRGLSSPAKFLLPKYFYDDLGSLLFASICLLPEYYLTRVESEILAAHGGEVLAELPSPLRLIELGSGESQKTRLLISAILDRQPGLQYVPIDISPGALERASEQLLQAHPRLRVDALAGEYRACLRVLAAEGPAMRGGATTLVLFLGSTLGNLDPGEQTSLLRSVREVLRPGDGMLLGVDWKKPAAELLPAYDDALGVTAAFNLNLLLRINRELGGAFDLAAFQHLARYDEERSRIEMHLVSRRAQLVTIEALRMEVPFAAGESVHTESSYRFDGDDLAARAAGAGFALARTWFDDRRRFASVLLLAV
jgi:dimethylhistidine N-methyltransferase